MWRGFFYCTLMIVGFRMLIELHLKIAAVSDIFTFDVWRHIHSSITNHQSSMERSFYGTIKSPWGEYRKLLCGCHHWREICSFAGSDVQILRYHGFTLSYIFTFSKAIPKDRKQLNFLLIFSPWPSILKAALTWARKPLTTFYYLFKKSSKNLKATLKDSNRSLMIHLIVSGVMRGMISFYLSKASIRYEKWLSRF